MEHPNYMPHDSTKRYYKNQNYTKRVEAAPNPTSPPNANQNYKGQNRTTEPTKSKRQEERLKKIEKEMNVVSKKMCCAVFKTSEDRPKTWDLGMFAEKDEGKAWSRAFQLVPYDSATGHFPHGKIIFSALPVLKIEKQITLEEILPKETKV